MSAPSASRDNVRDDSETRTHDPCTNFFRSEVDDCLNRVYNRQKEIMDKNSDDLIQKHQKLLQQALMTMRSQPIILPSVNTSSLTVPTESSIQWTAVATSAASIPTTYPECDCAPTTNLQNHRKNTSRERYPPSPEEISQRLHYCLNEEHNRILQKVNDVVEEQKRMDRELEKLKKRHKRELKTLKRKQQNDHREIMKEVESSRKKHNDYEVEMHNQGQLMQMLTLSKALFLDHSASTKLLKYVEILTAQQDTTSAMESQ